MENVSYIKISPSDVFIVVPDAVERSSTPESITASQWVEVRASGNSFVDLFVQLVHRHGKMSVSKYAAMMGVERRLLAPALIVLTGLGVHEWVLEYLRMVSCVILEKTRLPVRDVAKLMGFSSSSTFCQFFSRVQHCTTYEWRCQTRPKQYRM